jgi:hypothetical protein
MRGGRWEAGLRALEALDLVGFQPSDPNHMLRLPYLALAPSGRPSPHPSEDSGAHLLCLFNFQEAVPCSFLTRAILRASQPSPTTLNGMEALAPPLLPWAALRFYASRVEVDVGGYTLILMEERSRARISVSHDVPRTS